MTDNETIKALECCTGIINIESCSQCPAYVGCADCVDILREESLALINRQQAEIERLQKELSAKRPSEEYPFKVKVGNNSEIHSKSIEDYDRLLIDISAEAIKEFIKKHREIMLAFCDDDDQISLKVCEYDANTENLVKEMAGDAE